LESSYISVNKLIYRCFLFKGQHFGFFTSGYVV